MLKRVSSIITFISFFITFITFAAVVEISSWAELAAINSALDGDYVLVNDLSSETEGYDDYAGSSANGGAGWLPIGDFNNRFTGSFNGGGHSISDLYIYRNSINDVGLIGACGTGAVIHDLAVLDANITGNERVGVLAGMGAGWGSEQPHIYNCMTSGSVSGTNNVGGFIGVTSDDYGIGDIYEDCYSYTNVTASNKGGGFVGEVAYYSDVRRCYSFGSVSGSDKHGFAGSYTFSGTITDCFWDTEASGCPTSALGTGKTTAQMKSTSTYPAYEEPTHQGTVNVWIDLEYGIWYVDWVSGDKFDGLQVNDVINVLSGSWYPLTILEVVSNERLKVDNQNWLEGYGLTYRAGGNPEGWNITTKENFDPDNPTVWFIDDGNDYPRLWYEWTGGGTGGGTQRKKQLNIIFLN